MFHINNMRLNLKNNYKDKNYENSNARTNTKLIESKKETKQL
jgi:hypothetical protein